MSGDVIINIPLDQVRVEGRLRPVDPDTVRNLALSMQDDEQVPSVRRQINPIIVRPANDGGYLVVAGAHRVAAARKLGWPDIAAIVSKMSDNDAIATEIDENLYRKDLTGVDRTFFVMKKLEFYVYSGGKFKRGKDLRKGPTVGLLPGDAENKEVIKFYKELEKKFGFKRSTAAKLIRRGRNISPDLWKLIRGQTKPTPDNLLDKIASLEGKKPGNILKIVSDRGCSISEAVKIAIAPTQQDLERAQLEALTSAWTRASESVRAQFQKFLKAKKS